MPENARYKTIRFVPSQPIAWIVLNRPRSANCVNLAMAQEMRQIVQQLREEDGIRVAIVTGAGGGFLRAVREFPGARTKWRHSG